MSPSDWRDKTGASTNNAGFVIMPAAGGYRPAFAVTAAAVAAALAITVLRLRRREI